MSKLISPPEWQSGLLQEFTILPEEEPKSELWINTRAGAGVKSTVFFRCWIISGISREWQHRCRSKQTFGGANDFCPNFPKLARKAVLRLLPTDARSWRPVAILRGGWVGHGPPSSLLGPPFAPPSSLLGPPFGPPSYFLNFPFKFVWLTNTGLPNAFCKNTGHFVNSARSELCRNS